MQAARKIEQSCQTWVASPVFDVYQPAEAHAASIRQLLKGEFLCFP